MSITILPDGLIPVCLRGSMTDQRKDRIEPGQNWTGRSGMGPDLVVESVDLETGRVHARYVPTDPEHPIYTTDLNNFYTSFRLK